MDERRDLLQAMASAGPYGVVAEWEPDEPWRPLRDLVDDPDVARERVEHTRRVLAARSRVAPDAIEERAAASIMFLGLAARLTTPLLAAAVVHGGLPSWTVDTLWWQPVDGGPWPVAWSGRDEIRSGEALATDLVGVVDLVAAPLVDAFAETFGLSRQILWGNVTSSLGGALTVLASTRPDLGEHATDVVAAALAIAPLVDTADLRRPRPGRSRPSLVRRSCCLFYRVPGGGTCGDCVLTTDRPTGA